VPVGSLSAKHRECYQCWSEETHSK